jgi:hypothetical protein
MLIWESPKATICVAKKHKEDTMNSTINHGGAAEALDILYQFRGDLVPERSWTESLTGTVSNRATGLVLADDYIALLEDMLDDGAEDRVTVAPVSADEARAVWREAQDEYGWHDEGDYDEWIVIQIREREATEMTPGVVTELVVPAYGWY